MKTKPKRGRPSKPPAERVRVVSTSLPPHAVEHLRRVGGGSESRGLRVVVMAAVETAARS